MQALIALLVNTLRTMLMVKAGVIIAKIMLFFGLSFTTYKLAVGPIMDQINGLIMDGPGGSIGGLVMEWGGVLKFDQALTMILSAYVTAQTIRSSKTVLGIVDPA